MLDDILLAQEERDFLEDLRAWLDEQILTNFVLDAVQATNETVPGSPVEARQIPAGRARTLVSLLTFSYAAGIYSSEDVEIRIPSDPQLRYLAAGARPTWHDLRESRRCHRQFLKQSLTKVLETAER